MKPALSALLLLGALIIPATLAAQTAPPTAKATPTMAMKTYTVPDTDITIALPTTWKVTPSKTTLDAQHPKVNLAVSLVGFPSKDMTTALDYMEREFKKKFKKIKPMGDPAEATINGLPAVVAGFKTNLDGNDVEVMVAVILSPRQKAALIVALGDDTASKSDTAAQEMAAILESINSSAKPGTGGIKPIPKTEKAPKKAAK